MSFSPPRAVRYQPWLARYCCMALVVTTFLLFAGGYTTSTKSGMAFLTWPLSNGSLNPPGWVDNSAELAEHSHRLIAMTVGLLSIGVVLWTQLTEGRRWVRNVAIVVLLTVVLQGCLGGARVLFDKLNTGSDTNYVAQTFAVLHAAVAEITTCLWVTLTVAVSRGWMVRGVGAQLVAPTVRRWGHIACAIIFLQIFIGAIMRHGGYAFAIPTFPWSGPDHEILPLAWSWPVVVNFAHRMGAVLAAIAIFGLAYSVFSHDSARRQLGSWMVVILMAVVVQIGLGAEVIWTNKNPNVATIHLLTGAFLLASTWLLTFLSYRSKWWPPAEAGPSALS